METEPNILRLHCQVDPNTFPYQVTSPRSLGCRMVACPKCDEGSHNTNGRGSYKNFKMVNMYLLGCFGLFFSVQNELVCVLLYLK